LYFFEGRFHPKLFNSTDESDTKSKVFVVYINQESIFFCDTKKEAKFYVKFITKHYIDKLFTRYKESKNIYSNYNRSTKTHTIYSNHNNILYSYDTLEYTVKYEKVKSRGDLPM
jgi:hypothetical protein